MGFSVEKKSGKPIFLNKRSKREKKLSLEYFYIKYIYIYMVILVLTILLNSLVLIINFLNVTL